MMGETTIEWGETEEDVAYVSGILTEIQNTGHAARTADTYADGHAALVETLRGQATMLGLAIPAREDVIKVLTEILLRSRDHESDISEAMIATTRGKSPEEARQIRLAASAHSGRRGWLDSTAYEIGRGVEALDELKTYEARGA